MLYSLKDKELPLKVYGRSRKDILDLVRFYMVRDKDISSRPDYAQLLRFEPPADNIEREEEGSCVFSVGACKIPLKFEELKVSDDFTLFCNAESALSLEWYRNNFKSFRRANLYKIQIREGGIPQLCYIPKDVMQGIIDYDLTDLLAKYESFTEEFNRIPNMRTWKRQ